MHDIFISYSRRDIDFARDLANDLEQEGFSVWWDRDIKAGTTFDVVIEEAIDNAKCVVILWSKDSVKSEWARAEAEVGRQRKVLVPVLIDDVAIPLVFRSIQTANLISWDRSHEHPDFVRLVSDIRSIIGSEPRDRQTTSQGHSKSQSHSNLTTKTPTTSGKSKKLLMALGALLVICLVGWIIYQNIPEKSDPGFFIVAHQAWDTEPQANANKQELEEAGYDASYLWIPEYESLSKTEKYQVYIGPFEDLKECAKATERVRANLNPNAYGLWVGHEKKRIEIRGIDKIDTLKNFYSR